MAFIIKPLVTEKMTKITDKQPNRYGFVVRPCDRAVAYLDNHILGQNVLAVKEHLERSPYLVQRPLTLMERADDG